MNIEDLTIKEARELSSLFNGINSNNKEESKINNLLIGEYCIFRTYSAGVFFGKLIVLEGNQCMIDECRRLWFWKTKGGISISEVANKGLHDDSKVCEPTHNHCIEKIEIIPCSEEAIKDIKGKPNYVN